MEDTVAAVIVVNCPLFVGQILQRVSNVFYKLCSRKELLDDVLLTNGVSYDNLRDRIEVSDRYLQVCSRPSPFTQVRWKIDQILFTPNYARLMNNNGSIMISSLNRQPRSILLAAGPGVFRRVLTSSSHKNEREWNKLVAYAIRDALNVSNAMAAEAYFSLHPEVVFSTKEEMSIFTNALTCGAMTIAEHTLPDMTASWLQTSLALIGFVRSQNEACLTFLDKHGIRKCVKEIRRVIESCRSQYKHYLIIYYLREDAKNIEYIFENEEELLDDVKSYSEIFEELILMQIEQDWCHLASIAIDNDDKLGAKLALSQVTDMEKDDIVRAVCDLSRKGKTRDVAFTCRNMLSSLAKAKILP